MKHILRIIRKKAAHIPLGLLTIGSLLPADWDVKLIDMNVEDLTDELLKWADLVMISAMLVQKESVWEIIDRCRQMEKAIVAGGPLFNSLPNDYNDIDYLILNEGEITLPIFLEDYNNGTARHIYASEKKPDIAKTPPPRWELININNYAAVSVQYSRGCPFDCEFCDVVSLNGRTPRVKSPEQMLHELDLIYERGCRGRCFIVADNFIGKVKEVKRFLKVLIPWQKARGYPFIFFTEASVNLAKDEVLMKLMTDAGFDCVFLGLETPADECLKECGKHQNLSVDLVKAVKTLHSNGIEVMGGFILGFDSDPADIFERQVHFIQTSGVVKAMIGLLNALPGTRLYQRLRDEARLLDSFTGDNCGGSINFIPRMDIATLLEGYQSVLRSLYSNKQYYYRIIEFLKHYKPARRRRVDWNDLRSFIIAIVHLGVLDKERIYFWKLLIKAFFYYRDSFGEAVSNAVFGYHIRKLL